MNVTVGKKIVKKMVEVEKEEKCFTLVLSEDEAKALRHLWGKGQCRPKDFDFLGVLDYHLPGEGGVQPGWTVRFTPIR